MSLTNITYDDYLTYDVGIQVEIQQDYCYAPAAALSIESLVAAFQTRVPWSRPAMDDCVTWLSSAPYFVVIFDDKY